MNDQLITYVPGIIFGTCKRGHEQMSHPVLTLALSTLGIRTFLFSILSPCLSPSSGKSIRFPSDRNARRSDGFIRKPKGIRGSPVRYAMLAARSVDVVKRKHLHSPLTPPYGSENEEDSQIKKRRQLPL